MTNSAEIIIIHVEAKLFHRFNILVPLCGAKANLILPSIKRSLKKKRCHLQSLLYTILKLISPTFRGNS